MAATMAGDQAQWNQGATDTDACLKELESQLQALAGCRDGLQAAVQSEHTGVAIYQALDSAWTDGKALALTMQTIVDAMQKAGAQVVLGDETGKAQVAAAAAAGSRVGPSTIGTWDDTYSQA